MKSKEFEYITKDGDSYLFWIKKEEFQIPNALGIESRLIVTTRPHGYIFDIIRAEDGTLKVDWECFGSKRLSHRKKNMSHIPGYIEYIERVVKMLAFT